MSRSSRNSEKKNSRNDFYRGDNSKTERRTLFNPQSDNPVAFNSKSDGSNSTSQRSYSALRQRQGLEQQQLQQRSTIIHESSSANSTNGERSSRFSPGRPTRGTLWDPNSKPVAQRTQHPPQTLKQQRLRQQPVQQTQNDSNTTTATLDHPTSSSTSNNSNITKDVGDKMMTSKEQEHRMQLKTLLNKVQKLQAKITKVDESTSTDHPYFHGLAIDSNGTLDKRRQRQRQRGTGNDGDNDDDDDAFLYDRQPPRLTDTHPSPTIHPWLTMTLQHPLWESTEHIWKDKMQLHLQLANAYLDIIQYDDTFAETNHLTSLCWKRAIYSLVEQFRQAFARQQSLAVAVAVAASTNDHGSSSSRPTTTTIMDNSDSDDESDFVPMVTENGMTMVALTSDSENDDGEDETDKASLQKIMDKHLAMLRMWMDTFLLVADDYYQRMMVVLRDLENQKGDCDLERSLHSWRRMRRWKWYRCLPYRGDLARYRFIYGQNKGDYALAWRWYSLGVWMIPATGRFYFHQSLLLNSPQYSPLYELHKLYFGIRSLMVQRNGFVNSREGLVTLFENNRQWYAAITKTGKNKKVQRRRQQQRQRQVQDKYGGGGTMESDKMVSGLFICLHGMLFTKINLDAFTQTKRRYFETLFPSTITPVASIPADDSSQQRLQHSQQHPTTLSCQHLFWLETIILNISSLYSYDYASSTFTKALTLNKTAWVSKYEKLDGTNSTQRTDNWNDILETLDDNSLFSYSIDMICQVVIELVSRSSNSIATPTLPPLPSVELNLKANESLLFGTDATINTDKDDVTDVENDDRPWLIYIYVLLHWMVVTGICVSGDGSKSIWETVIGQVTCKMTGATSNNMDKITRTFWPLLMSFLTQLLQDLPETQRYQVIDCHLLDTNNPWITDEQHEGGAWDDYIMHLMGPYPVLPEDDYLRGLGWLDQALSGGDKDDNKNDSQTNTTVMMDMDLQRRIRIIDYGFALVKQMHQTLEYDPVEEAFMVKSPPSPLFEKDVEEEKETSVVVLNEDDDSNVLPILTAMDDAVLFDSTNGLADEETFQGDQYDTLPHDSDGEADDDDMVGQLKKRRQHLQSMLTAMTEERQHAATYGYQKLTMQGRGKEREARLNRIREKVIPGKTVLVLDTNCFIGHMDAIRKLIQGGKWSIVIPLVVITELDGLKSNAGPLGTVADEALQSIETALASKQTRPDAIRIQTSHHNFMYDISIRSEQFIFGETDKNLDDLILSTCLWWNNNSSNNKKQQLQPMDGVPVCLVTADRNLSVKARARDVQVIPVSGLMKINPLSLL